MSFDAFMDEWARKRVLGLPLRMIFNCEWHSIHLAMIFAGVVVGGVGSWKHVGWMRIAGAAIAVPSLLCFALLVGLMPICLLLERLFPRRPR